MNDDDKLRSIEWNIQDAKDALACALDLQDWDGCIKYANQLKVLTRNLYDVPINASLR